MISSFQTSFANTPTSPQIVPDGQSRTLLKVSDDSAARQAKLQAAGKPWLCVKHKVTVTNEKCKAMKIASDTRQCSDCGLPLALGIVTREELKMGKTQKHRCPNCGEECLALFGKRKVCWKCREEEKKAKGTAHACLPADEQGRVVPASNQLVVSQDVPKVEPVEAFPDWDSFVTFNRQIKLESPAAIVGGALDRVGFNSPLQRLLGWKPSQRVEVRIGEKSLAFKPAGQDDPNSYRLISSGNNSTLYVSCKAILKKVPAVSGTHEVTITPWGLIVHLDRPLAAKA